MTGIISVRSSQKAVLFSKEQYIVTFGSFVCLRILSIGGSYAVVTATADEDSKQFLAPENKALLIELGQRTAYALGVAPTMCRDNFGRDYVAICEIDNEEDAAEVVEVFGRLLHKHIQGGEQVRAGELESEAGRELREVYEAIAPDDTGDDAYLGDGVWLSRDGGWSDRGR